MYVLRTILKQFWLWYFLYVSVLCVFFHWYVTLAIICFVLFYAGVGFIVAFFAHHHGKIDYSNVEDMRMVKALMLFWPYALTKYALLTIRQRSRVSFENRVKNNTLPFRLSILQKMPTREQTEARKKLKEINKNTQEMQSSVSVSSEPVTGYGWE